MVGINLRPIELRIQLERKFDCSRRNRQAKHKLRMAKQGWLAAQVGGTKCLLSRLRAVAISRDATRAGGERGGQ